MSDLNAVEAHAPLQGGVGHVVLHAAVDRLTLGQRLVEGELAEHGAQRGARELVDRQLVVVDFERADFTRSPGREMVALTQRDTLSLVITDCWSPSWGNSRMSTFSSGDEGPQHPEAGLVHRLELPEPLDDPDACLLDDLHAAGQEEGPPAKPATTATATIP